MIVDNTALSLGQAVGKLIEFHIDGKPLSHDLHMRRRIIAALPFECRYIDSRTGDVPALQTLEAVLTYQSKDSNNRYPNDTY